VAIVAWLAYEAQSRATGIGRWAEQALPAAQRSASGYRSAVLGAAGAAAFNRGDLEASERYARAAVEEGYPPDDPSPGLAPMFLAGILVYQGRDDDAARHLDAADKAMIGRDDEDYVRSLLRSVRVSMTFADDPDEEISQARLGMSLAQRTGNPTILAVASYALGVALRHRHPDEALAALDQSVALAKRGAASTVVLATALSYAAQAAAALGEADGARARLRDALEEAQRNDDWIVLAMSLDAAVDIFSNRGEARSAAVLAGAVETTLAPLRFPYTSSHGPGLAVRTANLARARQELGDSLYQQARAQGAAMSRQDALAFTLRHL
jgi:ATP/maltotriose-dependent transcriptional regulator MalT